MVCAAVNGHPSCGDESNSVVMRFSFTGGSGNGSGAVPFLFPVAFATKGLKLVVVAFPGLAWLPFADGGQAVTLSTSSERMYDAPPNLGKPSTA